MTGAIRDAPHPYPTAKNTHTNVRCCEMLRRNCVNLKSVERADAIDMTDKRDIHIDTPMIRQQ